MKKVLWLLLTLSLTVSSVAQDSGPVYAVAERGPHHALWQRVTWSSNLLGSAVRRTNSFVELATGLNFFDEMTQQWQPSREEWQAFPDAIIAQAGQQKVILATNLNLGGSVDVLTPDGVRLISSPVGLGFYDPVDGKQALLAEVKDCAPQRGAAANEIVFRDCFNGIRGSIRYLYTRGGFHQHVVLEQRLQLPEGFSDRSRLELYTEFAPATAQPLLTTRVLRRENDPILRAQMVEPDFSDSQLDFGVMGMGAGTAFTLGNATNTQPIRVGKRFAMMDGRPVLTEAVEWRELEPLLAGLASVEQSTGRAFAVNSSRQLPQAKKQALLSREYFRRLPGENEVQLASNPLNEAAVVIDYEFLSSETNQTFKSDTTYFVSGSVNLSGTTTLEGTVVKFTNSTQAKITINGPIRCQTGPYRPAIFTTKDDNSVGATIPGSTGNPTNINASGLVIKANGNVLTNLRFAYLFWALRFDKVLDGGQLDLSDVQFVKCRYPLVATLWGCFSDCTATVNLANALAFNCDVFFQGDQGVLRAQHLTVNQCTTLGSDDGNDSSMYLTNSLLVAVTNWGNIPYTNNTTVYYSTDPGGIFQTVAAGAHYLINDSTNRNAGTTNINAVLLAALRQRTTYPPTIRSNITISANTNFVPLIARDTNNLPDLGFHYAAIDYLTYYCVVTNATLTVTNGAVIACYNDVGIWLRDNSAIMSVGSPLSPNRFTRYSSVQEQSISLGAYGPEWGLGVVPDYGSAAAHGEFRFTEFACPSGGGYHVYHSDDLYYGDLVMRDCSFWSGDNYLGGPNASASALVRNNLFFRSSISALASSSAQATLSFSNNLLYGISAGIRSPSSGTWRAYNNAFDGCAIASGSVVTNGNNAYINYTNRLTPTNINDVLLTSFTYATGPLGNFYQAAGGALIDRGSTDAYSAGLYHFTTTTNQVKESYSVVDIGFHYVAFDSGVPSDLDGDGIPDYADPDAEPPMIVAQTQPDRQWSYPGGPLLLSVSASGAPFLIYQWKLFGTNIPSAASSTYQVLFGTSEERQYSCTVENAAGITSSQTWKVRALIEGSIAAWGANGQGQLDRPANATNVIAVAAGGGHSLAVREVGSMIAWGLNDYGQTNVATLTNAIAAAAGNKHSLTLRDNGTAVAWGRNTEGQTNVPSGLTNVIAIAAGGNQSMALLRNGTVTNWGNTFGTIPPSLTNAIAIAAGTNFCLALRSNGTVVAWGDNGNGQTNVPPSATNAIAIATGDFHALALKENGTVVSWGLNTSGQTNVPSGLSNVMALAAGRAHSVALKNDGTVVAWGDNSNGQTNIGGGLTRIKSIAGGGDHTLAAVFSELVQYQVDVSKDLLLIYNTNSMDSTNVLNYYLERRPMITGANVLGIGCTINEATTPSDFTNQIGAPILSWLTNSPTKRPQYVVVFLGVPTLLTDGGPNVGKRVRFNLSSTWHPFVNYINFEGTNDCKAYIDKLHNIGTSNSPGKLLIRASAGGYSDTNYCVDAVTDQFLPDRGREVTNSLMLNGVSAAAITYADGSLLDVLTNHITLATNVVAYFSYGTHTSVDSFGPIKHFVTNGTVRFYGQSGWFIMTLYESYGGSRYDATFSTYIDWFAATSFGGTNYENTAVAAAANTDECGCSPEPGPLFTYWATGRNAAMCCWYAGGETLALGDPLVRR